MTEILLFNLHVENYFYIVKQTKDIMYIKRFFYKNCTGGLSNLLFVASASEHSWQISSMGQIKERAGRINT